MMIKSIFMFFVLLEFVVFFILFKYNILEIDINGFKIYIEIFIVFLIDIILDLIDWIVFCFCEKSCSSNCKIEKRFFLIFLNILLNFF